jgi:hypothetical protein
VILGRWNPVGASLLAKNATTPLVSGLTRYRSRPSSERRPEQARSYKELTVTESETMHVSKSAFSICNRTLSLRPLPAETLLLLTSRLLLSAYPPEKDQELRLYA